MEDKDEFDIKPENKKIAAKIIIERTDNKIPYIDILRQIKTGKIDKNNLTVIDNKGKCWNWSADINGFEHREANGGLCGDDWITYLTDEYDEIELPDLLFTIIPTEKIEETPKYIATQEVIDMIETLYMDLDMEIDNCQGCMEGLDEAFEKLRIYKNIVKFLGGDIENHIQELTDKWFENAHKRSEKEKQEQEKRDKVIQKLSINVLDFFDLDEPLRNILWKYSDKINEICDILIEMKKEK